MVDFRYHLVSLIAVFMALAIGIVLGAGPLQNSIGNTLTDQVTSLRQSRDEARLDADRAEAEADSYRSGIEAASGDLLADTLTGVNVAILALPGADTGEIAELGEAIEMAGGTVASEVKLTAGLFSTDLASYRQALAGQLSSYVADSGEPIDVLADGLAQIVLTPEAENAGTLRELYTSEENPLIAVDEPLAPAHAILVVAPKEDGEAESVTEEESAARDAQMSFLKALGEHPLVLVGSDSDISIIRQARSSEVGSSFSTVDAVGDPTALINVPRALSQELAGSTVAWGLGSDATAVLGAAADIPQTPADNPDDPAVDTTPDESGEEDPAGEVDGEPGRDGGTEGEANQPPLNETPQPPAPEES